MSLLESWSQVVTLLADVICPESQKEVVCDWQPAQFGGRCDLGAETAEAPCLSASGCRTPASLPPGREGCKW